MRDHTNLKAISDAELLRRLTRHVSDSRRVEADLVADIAEVDDRRLYAREAAPSMYACCTERLHLSEAEAWLRIRVARASRKHPVILPMLRDGRLHLSGIVVLVPHLTSGNRDSLLKRAVHKTKRQSSSPRSRPGRMCRPGCGSCRRGGGRPLPPRSPD